MPWTDPAVIKQKTREAQDWNAALHLFKKFQHDSKVYNITRQSWRDFPPSGKGPSDPLHIEEPQDYQKACENRQESAAEDERSLGRHWIDILNDQQAFIEITLKKPEAVFQENEWDMHRHGYIQHKDEMVDFGGVQVKMWPYAEQYVEKVLKVNNWQIDEEPTALKAFAFTDYKTPDGHELPGRPAEAQSTTSTPASSTPASSGLMGPPPRRRSRFATPDGRDILIPTTKTPPDPPAADDDDTRPTKAQKRS